MFQKIAQSNIKKSLSQVTKKSLIQETNESLFLKKLKRAS